MLQFIISSSLNKSLRFKKVFVHLFGYLLENYIIT